MELLEVSIVELAFCYVMVLKDLLCKTGDKMDSREVYIFSKMLVLVAFLKSLAKRYVH